MRANTCTGAGVSTLAGVTAATTFDPASRSAPATSGPEKRTTGYGDLCGDQRPDDVTMAVEGRDVPAAVAFSGCDRGVCRGVEISVRGAQYKQVAPSLPRAASARAPAPYAARGGG